MSISTQFKLQFGTKAETLERLKPLVHTCKVLDLFYFSVVDWSESPDRVLDEIKRRFQKYAQIVVRSSAYSEDTSHQSLAGKYVSFLNVDISQNAKIHEAIEKCDPFIYL